MAISTERRCVAIGLNCTCTVALFGMIVLMTLYFQAELQSVRTQLKSELNTVNDEIYRLHYILDTELNRTIKHLNTTVTEAQESMQQEIQTVNEDVSTQNSLLAYQFAGTFTLLGCLITLWHFTAHLRKFNEPFVQRKILAILWMCPIYSITSWLSLVFTSAEGYLGVIKDCYEAYCIYTFLAFLIAVLGRGDRNAVVDLLANHADHLKPPIRFPCGLLAHENGGYEKNARAKADAVLHQCQFFAMQFVLLRPLTGFAMAISNQLYKGVWDYTSPQFYIIIVTNISVFFAFSGLVKFYHAVQEDLAWCRPFPKFLCIKGIVFMTFWQNMAIALLAKTVWRDKFEDNEEDPREWSAQAQNFLICLEMLFFAIAHCFVFPTDEWEEGYRPSKSRGNAKFGDNMALHDFLQDVKLILRHRKSRKGGGEGGKGDSVLLPSDATPPRDGLLNDLTLHETYDEGKRGSLSEVGIDVGTCDGDDDGINWERIEKFIEGSDGDGTSREVL